MCTAVENELFFCPPMHFGMEYWTAFFVTLSNHSLFLSFFLKQTHVLSFILHIAKSDDAEDWPIFAEDFEGNTHEGKTK